MNNSNIKTAVFWVVIIMVVVLLWTVVRNNKSRPDAQLSYTQLMNDVQAGKIKSVSITGNDLHGIYKEDNQELHSVIPTNHQPLDDAMLAKGVDVKYQKETGSGWVSILINAIPFVLLLAFWIFMMRQMQSGGKRR
jgi:cell division protease FtsH